MLSRSPHDVLLRAARTGMILNRAPRVEARGRSRRLSGGLGRPVADRPTHRMRRYYFWKTFFSSPEYLDIPTVSLAPCHRPVRSSARRHVVPVSPFRLSGVVPFLRRALARRDRTFRPSTREPDTSVSIPAEVKSDERKRGNKLYLTETIGRPRRCRGSESSSRARERVRRNGISEAFVPLASSPSDEGFTRVPSDRTLACGNSPFVQNHAGSVGSITGTLRSGTRFRSMMPGQRPSGPVIRYLVVAHAL